MSAPRVAKAPSAVPAVPRTTGRMSVDTAEVRRALALLVMPGAVFEVRVPKAGRYGTVRGYFDDCDAAAAAIAAGPPTYAAPGWYVTLNPVNPALLARAANRLAPYADTTTADVDVLARHWLPIDADAVRPAGISATDAEHDAALARADGIRAWLVDEVGVPAAAVVLADSGNGGHVLVRIDLPNDAAASALVERCLAAVKAAHSDATVKVDTSVANPSRIWKLYGTTAAKGDATADHPHRLARLVDVPASIAVCPRAVLDRLAALAPRAGTGDRASGAPSGDVASVLAGLGCPVRRPKPARDGGTMLDLAACPWNPSHATGAWVLATDRGIVAAGCHHESCHGRSVADLPPSLRPWVASRTGSTDGVAHDTADPWPEPLPLASPCPPPFPVDALPPVLGELVADVARVVQVPHDLPGAAVLGVIAACGARRAVVAVGRTHAEPLALYVAAVSPSGTRKSAALDDVLGPLYERQRDMQRAAEPDVRAAAERRKAAEARLDALRKQQARSDDSAERERLAAEGEALARVLPPVPALPRLTVDDRTPEALALDLAEQGGAVLLVSAEGADLFAVAAGRHARDGGDQATLYLHAYDGEPIDVRRITREAVRVDDPALSIVVTPQPVVLARLREHPELHHRGLVPRFALVVAPDLAGTRQYHPHAAPDARIRAAYAAALDRLLTLPRPAEAAETPRLRLDGAALDVWAAYHDRVEHDLGDGGPLAPIREWASKHAGRVARIAGALHLVGTVGSGRPWVEAIPPETVAAAVRLGDYLTAHALVAYDVMRADPDLARARTILRWLGRTRAVQMTERDAHRALSSATERTAETAAAACRLLVEHGWLRPLDSPPRSGAGRPPSPAYAVHPRLAESLDRRQNRQNPPPARPESDSVDIVDDCAGSEPEAEQEVAV